MGNGDSKESSSEGNKGSRRARFKERLHLGRHSHHDDRRRRNGNGSSGSSSSALKHISADNFAGIAILTLIRAEMQFKDKWIACLSLGEQAFRTMTSD